MLIKIPEDRIDTLGILEYLDLNYKEPVIIEEDVENKIAKFV